MRGLDWYVSRESFWSIENPSWAKSTEELPETVQKEVDSRLDSDMDRSVAETKESSKHVSSILPCPAFSRPDALV